jgi:hypothetical protein
MSRVGWVALVRARRKAGASDLVVWERAARTGRLGHAIRVAPSLRLGFVRSREFGGMADCCFPASSDTLSFRVLGRRMGLRFVCSRVAIVFIPITAGTRKKSSSFPIEFATKTPDVAHIVCVALRCARAMRRDVVDVGRGLRAWKCA